MVIRRHPLLFAAAVVASGALLLVLVVVSLFTGSFPGGTAGCSTDGAGPVVEAGAAHVAGMTPVQLANAGAIITEGRRRGVPARAVLIALATASQESGFKNYANDGRGTDLSSGQMGIGRSLLLPHDAVGSDHGSLGLFQQQWPWWGDMDQLMNPTIAAGKFYDALQKVPGWQGMPVTVAAQRVQRSAFPDAYADDESLARELLGGPAGAARIDQASFTASRETDCFVAQGAGTVRFPLPPGAHYVDNRNWGRRSGHWASWHTGTDLSASCGTPVLAATSGTVVVRTDQSWAGRWLVQVSTGIGQLTTWYAHMRALSVSDGDAVAAGQQIGEVGDLGNATGCHLHFEVHPRGGSIYQDSVNPTSWLAQNVGRPTESDAVPVSSSNGSAFTIATFNVLGASHTRAGGEKPWMASGSARVAGVIRLLDGYGVDVVGLQEFQRPQYETFRAHAGWTYDVWSPGHDKENAIAWRRSRWSFVAGRALHVPYFNGATRRMPVVRLLDRVTGQTAVFVNVHNPADTGKYHHQGRWRDEAVRREVQLVRELSSSGEAVFLTGDFNATSKPFCAMTHDGLMTAANGGRSGSACHVPQGAGIDWIFGNRATGFDDYTVDRGTLVRRTTDHPIVLARAVVR